jgi:transcriptional regulator with XRE-family HTH domain
MPKLSNVGPLLNKHLDSRTETERARLFSQLTRKEVAVQIRQLRERRQLTQVEFGKRCNMKQSAVSRIEQAEYTGWTYKTLSRIAEQLNARLRITYEPLEEIAAQLAAEADSEPARERIRHVRAPLRPGAKTNSKSRARSRRKVEA